MLVFVRRALTVSCVFSAMLMGLSFYAQDFLSILIYCVVVLTQATLVPTKFAGA
jgi:hypothetical protein